MTKTDIRKSLERCGRDFIGLYEASEIIGVDRGTMRKWLNGVSFIRCGKRKLFHINDITERLMQLREN